MTYIEYYDTIYLDTKGVFILKKRGVILKKFLSGVKKEMHKVRWPNKKEMAVYSAATLFCVIVFSLFFTGLDFLISAIKEVIY